MPSGVPVLPVAQHPECAAWGSHLSTQADPGPPPSTQVWGGGVRVAGYPQHGRQDSRAEPGYAAAGGGLPLGVGIAGP